jgi:hypothetical protein|tara:strand:+ start:276 stop:458 length:183 start_codon:yes stop_codon:yes gene_type:complete
MSTDIQRERAREHQRRVRVNKPTISFVTDLQAKEDLLSMAKYNGYKSIKEFMEVGYRDAE